MNYYTIKGMEEMLAPGVKIVGVERHNKWIILSLSSDFGTGGTTLRFKEWNNI